MPSLMQSFKRMTPKGWAMVGGSVAAGLVFLVVLMQMAGAPSYSTLETGLDPAQTGKITSTLSTQGITYQLQNNGTALAVQSDKVPQARVALATAGLLGNSQPGFSLMDKQQLGQSNFQQQVTYERALEGQLASTIETIDGISSAQVNLVLPNTQDQLFSDQQQPSTASVLLSGSSSLQSSSVRGIAQLVASSVPGLQSSKVTITGSDGSLLWPNGSTTGDSGGMPAQLAANQRYDSATTAAVDAMLTQTLGAGKAQVTINGDVDANQATQQSLIYAKKGVPLTQQKSTETLKGAGAGKAGGSSGASANIPAYAAAGGAAGGSGASNYKNQTVNTNFGVNKTITHSVIAAGAVKRQSVSVLVDKSVPAASIPAIKSAVANAVGLDPKRGDAISVAQLAFAPASKTAPVAAAANPMMKYAKYGAIGLASLLFLVFAGRTLRKRERESFGGQPTWLRELEAPRTLASLEHNHPPDVAALQPAVNVARRQVEDLVQRDPERVAAQVRAWMNED